MFSFPLIQKKEPIVGREKFFLSSIPDELQKATLIASSLLIYFQSIFWLLKTTGHITQALFILPLLFISKRLKVQTAIYLAFLSPPLHLAFYQIAGVENGLQILIGLFGLDFFMCLFLIAAIGYYQKTSNPKPILVNTKKPITSQHTPYTGISKHIQELSHRLSPSKAIPAFGKVINNQQTPAVLASLQDPLTGLPSSLLFLDRLERRFKRSERESESLFALLHLDIDRFRFMKNSLGQMSANQIIYLLGTRLQTCLRENDTVSRFSHDEFILLLSELKDTSDALRVAARIQRELSHPFTIGNQEVFISVSIGIAYNHNHHQNKEGILQDAMNAMQKAKAMGKSRCEVFDRRMKEKINKRLQLETDLQNAIKNEEFCLYYQPIVNLKHSKLYGFEALLRWNHPRKGILSPGYFVQVAEETGQIIKIGHWVLKEACKQMREWQDKFVEAKDLCISVNLSSQELLQPGFVQQVAELLEETKLSPRQLKLEITESLLIKDLKTTIQVLNQLRNLNVRMSIDDFGTGYSSLSYLQKLPLDTLKIDRSFIDKMCTESDTKNIVEMIILLAHRLKMEVIAEGVENEEQRKELKSLECEYVQGYFYDRPLPREEVEQSYWSFDGVDAQRATVE